MSEENNNTSGEGKLPEGFRLVEDGEVIPAGYETRVDLTLEKTITNAPKKELPPPPDPPTLTATVDPKQKAEQTKTAFSFSNPSATHQESAQPTKGDIKQQQDSGLAALDKQIALDERADGSNMSPQDYQDNAEMILDMYESGLTFIARIISKDTSDSAYEFGKVKRDKLERQLVKVLRKRKVGLPIELMFAGTLLPATAQIIMKATDKRKEFMAQKRKEEKEKPKDEKTSGNSETPKRRPGRPTK